jgi:hypothetical protein
MRSLAVTISLALLTIGCHGGRSIRPQAGAGDQYLITATELDPAKQASVYEAVRQLRPSWLTRSVRGRTGENTVAVYVDDHIIGTMSALRRIPVTAAERIRYMSATEAQTRFGDPNGGRAAIIIESARP